MQDHDFHTVRGHNLEWFWTLNSNYTTHVSAAAGRQGGSLHARGLAGYAAGRSRLRRPPQGGTAWWWHTAPEIDIITLLL